MRVILLGASGLLGGAMKKALASSEIETIEASRTGPLHVDADKSLKANADFVRLVSKETVVVNCIGMVRHRIDSRTSSVDKAVRRNSLFPIQLAELSADHGFVVMQVLTDCVFSGRIGGYSELSEPDPRDTYGMTKSLGEINHENFLGIRSSILGTSTRGPKQFFDWVKYAPRQARLPGYTNHNWNGVTAGLMANLFAKIIEGGTWLRGIHHLVPADVVSKFDLAKLIAEREGRRDIQVVPTEDKVAVDRSLTSIDQELNAKLFKLAGFSEIPTIADILSLGVDFKSD